MTDAQHVWPELPLAEWQDTRLLLHACAQMLGKVRLAKAPAQNHWWHTTLYLTPSGLGTSAMPDGDELFELELDLEEHALELRRSGERHGRMSLHDASVAELYADFRAMLRDAGVDAHLWPVPVEVPEPVPFPEDVARRRYDGEQAHRFWQVLARSAGVMQRFRGDFLGKASPVHFFWGSFDLAATRFSGRRAPPHPGAPGVPDTVTREAYSHEVSSCGFWPGDPAVLPEPVYYAYAYPEPAGFQDFPVRPKEARYHPALREFVLPYAAVAAADDPERMLTEFLQSTYDAAAELGQWDRGALERH